MKWLLAAALLLAPLAAAQPPSVEGGQVEVAWTWAPGEFTADQGSVVDLRGTATMTLRGAVCAQEATLHAEATLTPVPETVSLKSDPLVLVAEARVPRGAYAEPLGQPFTASVEVPFRVLVDLDAAPGDYGMLVTTTVSPPQGCAAAGAGPGQSTATVQQEAFAIHVRATETRLAPHPPHEEHGAGGFDVFLEPGARKSWQFNATGRYTYHDHFRSELRGTVLVEGQGPASAEVQVTAQGFNPAEAAVRAGGNVTWVNADRVGHTVSADELHPEHGVSEEHEDGEPAMEGNITGDGDATAPSEPPRRSPGLEPLALGAALGVGALALRARLRRG